MVYPCGFKLCDPDLEELPRDFLIWISDFVFDFMYPSISSGRRRFDIVGDGVSSIFQMNDDGFRWSDREMGGGTRRREKGVAGIWVWCWFVLKMVVVAVYIN